MRWAEEQAQKAFYTRKNRSLWYNSFSSNLLYVARFARCWCWCWCQCCYRCCCRNLIEQIRCHINAISFAYKSQSPPGNVVQSVGYQPSKIDNDFLKIILLLHSVGHSCVQTGQQQPLKQRPQSQSVHQDWPQRRDSPVIGCTHARM